MPASYTAIGSTKAAIITTSLLDIGSNPFTACMWVRITSSASSYKGIISSEGGVGSGGIALMHRSTGKFSLWNGSFTDGNSFSLDTWYFVAYTLDSIVAGNLRLYQGTTPNNLTNSATYTPFASLASQKVVFGGYHTGDSNWMDGQIAHCHLYNTPLSLDQLREIMIKPGSLTLNGALLGYFPVTGLTPVTNLTGLANATENATMTASELGPPVFFPTLCS